MQSLNRGLPDSRGLQRCTAGARRAVLGWGCAAVAAAGLFLFCLPAKAQFRNPGKLPGINKITSNGPTRQAFSGSVQSLNRKQHVLNVTSEGSSAIFPIKKKVKVSSVTGAKRSLADLTPGTNVLVYYSQKDGRRTVDQILILQRAPASTASKKKPHTS